MINQFQYMGLQLVQMRAALLAMHDNRRRDIASVARTNDLAQIEKVAHALDVAIEFLQPLQVTSVKTVGHTAVEQEEHARSQMVGA